MGTNCTTQKGKAIRWPWLPSLPRNLDLISCKGAFLLSSAHSLGMMGVPQQSIWHKMHLPQAAPISTIFSLEIVVGPFLGGKKTVVLKKRWPVLGGASQDLYVAKNPYKLSIELCVCAYIYIFIYLFIYVFIYLLFIYLFIYSFIYFYPQWVISDIWVIKLYINHLLSGICTHPSRFPYHDR